MEEKIKKMDNLQKLATQGTQDDEIQSKNTTMTVWDTTVCKQTQISKIRHEPSYKQLGVKTNRTSFMQKSLRASQHGTQNINKHNRTT